jgi:hypothetical protein
MKCIKGKSRILYDPPWKGIRLILKLSCYQASINHLIQWLALFKEALSNSLSGAVINEDKGTIEFKGW